MPQNTDDFLRKCRSLIDNRKVDPFTNDPDNRNALNLLGYSVRNMLQEIKDLETCNLFEGPLPDRSSKYPGEVWVFKKTILGHLIYIKLKIRKIGGRTELFIMSFHPDRP